MIYEPAFSLTPKEQNDKEGVPDGIRGKGERILVVEDEDGVRGFARDALNENGYRVSEASSAKEAKELFEREKGNFGLVFSDVILPDRSCLAMVEELLARKPGLRVLLCSGYMGESSQWPVIKERGLPFLAKPYGLKDLLKAVKAAFEPGKGRQTEGGRT